MREVRVGGSWSAPLAVWLWCRALLAVLRLVFVCAVLVGAWYVVSERELLQLLPGVSS